MTAFDRALLWIWRAEGGLAEDPADHGGLTKFGISQRSYPNVDIRALTREDAAAIYRRDFWDACRCDELPEAVAIALFDGAVNAGPRPAIRFLQRAAGANPDGLLGADTLRAVGRHDPHALMRAYLVQRALHFARLATADYTQARFHKGWLARLFDLQAYLDGVSAATPAKREPIAAKREPIPAKRETTPPKRETPRPAPEAPPTPPEEPEPTPSPEPPAPRWGPIWEH